MSAAMRGLRQASPEFVLSEVGGVESYGSFHVRSVGGRPLMEAKLFRSRDIGSITEYEAGFLAYELGIRLVYDLRNPWERELSPFPSNACAMEAVPLADSPCRRKKDAARRLVAGGIGEYGRPEERMRANYRRYVCEYPAIGDALRKMARTSLPSLVHCVHGKDRTGVTCATVLRIAGFHSDDIMEDYLASNALNASEALRERELLGRGMTRSELAILDSFLEARPSYLEAFFDEASRVYGSFDRYVNAGLGLGDADREALTKFLVD